MTSYPVQPSDKIFVKGYGFGSKTSPGNNSGTVINEEKRYVSPEKKIAKY